MAGLALLVGSFVHLTRLYLSSAQKPMVAIDVESALKDRLKRSHAEFQRCSRSLTGLSNTRRRVVAAVIVAVSVGVFFSCGGVTAVRAVDGPAFDLISIGLQSLVFLALLLTCWQTLTLWRHLQMFLDALSALPLSRAFIQPQPHGETRPIWVRQLNLQSLAVHIKAATVMHDMSIEAKKRNSENWELIDAHYQSYRNAIRKFLKPTDGKPRAEIHSDHVALWEASQSSALVLLKQILIKHWPEIPLVSQPRQTGVAETERTIATSSYCSINGDPTNPDDLAEAFVALHYTSFLLYGVRQIQNLVWFPSIGLVLLILSLNSYNYQAPQTIGRFLFVLVLVIGAVLWKCLSGIEKDPILSKIAGTTPGKLNLEFYLKFAAYGALPLVGLLASQFPSISGFLFSWVEPSLEAMK
jgi:hypothetical protein